MLRQRQCVIVTLHSIDMKEQVPLNHMTYNTCWTAFFSAGIMQCQALVDCQEYMPSKQVAD